ncbi:MAG: DUF3450 domain-containing protein [Deltaproteobacteria bacterium]|nr:DUF3450 domain-containing protein [Deltaproteobacteria bacterium]
MQWCLRGGLKKLGGGLLVGLLLFGSGLVSAKSLKEVVQVENQRSKNDIASQRRIDDLSDAASAAVQEYRQVNRQISDLRIYNAQLQTLINDQQREVSSLQGQIESITFVERQIMPLMLRMTASLEQFVDSDIPFLPEQRSKRIADLTALMDRSDVTTSEKYRRLMEAYGIENEYGWTMDSYRGALAFEDASRDVDFLRLGRVALYYQTLNGSTTGMWDVEQDGWIELPGKYRDTVKQGLRIAKEQVAPDLLYLPVPAPVQATASVAGEVPQ